jgi:hypothetical protein
MRIAFALLCACAVGGCGPSDGEMRERTLSILNTEADRWDGGKSFETSVVDAYGRPISARVEKGLMYYVLEVRSNGRDGLLKNTDDIEVTRSKRHGESVVSDEAIRDVGKVSSGVTSGATSGVIEGIKEGFGLGRKNKN